MLDLAKRKLRQTMTALRPAIRRGTPIVVLEPSCASVFRDELVNLFPDDADARRLSRQVVLLGELLSQDKQYRPPKLERHALMHAHCHHKAVFRTDAEKKLLEVVGVDLETPETGCCGLAGSFGYEAGHYDVSMKIGENMLLPAVRKASPRTLVVADGFSCRLQIEHATGRKALHPAEVLQMALRYGHHGPAGAYPERGHTQEPARLSAVGAVAAVAGAALVAGLALWGACRMRRALS
jgi:Fe-S oxidoreductase